MKASMIYAAAAAGLLLGGCRKYAGPTQVSGTVVDEHTARPVPNATVQVLSSRTGWSGGGTGSGPTAQTDANGRFSLSFEASQDDLYQLQAYSASGYSPLGTPYVDGGRQTDNLLVKVKAPAWVNIVCVDDPPYGKVELITSGYSYSPSGISDDQYVGPGNYSFVRPTPSYNNDRSIYWKVVDLQTNSVEGRIPYTTTAFDTATVTIHF